MSIRKHTLNAMVATAIAMAGAGAATEAAHAAGGDMEKCYGVVKAGHNDCGSAAASHSCAGQASVDGHGGEFVAVPKGLCERLVGGSLEPYRTSAKTSGKGSGRGAFNE